MEFHDDIRAYVVPAELNDVGWTYIDSFVAEKLATRVEREAIGTAWTTRDGKFPKRVAKYLHRQGIKAAPEIVSEIGNIASRHVAQQSEYWIDFTDTIDWRAGDFGDAGSCYWGTNAAARDMLMENGAYAVRFYVPHENGIGRAWLAPYGDAWILFNAYGPYDLMTIARVLSHVFGVSYQRVRLTNQVSETGMLYINGGKGIAFGATPELVDLEWEGCEACAECGCSIDLDESYPDPDGRAICEDCYCNSYSSCDRCGETFSHESIVECHGRHAAYLCEHCAGREGFEPCRDCEHWHQCSARTIDDEPLCDSCAEDWSYCDGCGFCAQDAAEFSGEYLCSGCLDQVAELCDGCGTLTAVDDIQHVDGRAYCCPDCADGLPHYSGPAADQMELAFPCCTC